MKPYYEDGSVTIYHGDCLDVIGRDMADLVVTSPPYNCGMDYDGHNDQMPTDQYFGWLEDRYRAVAQALSAGGFLCFNVPGQNQSSQRERQEGRLAQRQEARPPKEGVVMTAKQERAMSVQERANQWIVGRDTGSSSQTIWAVMMGAESAYASYPYDPADFGRCYRLLALIPEWRVALDRVARAYPKTAWKSLVKHWDELTELYEVEAPSGTCPRLYARMRELRARHE
jgi:hypothetical protein